MPDAASLTNKERELIDGAAVAYSRASELLTWWKKERDAKALKFFNQVMPRSQDIKLECFYDKLTLERKDAGVMACSWKSRFPCKAAAAAVSSAGQSGMDVFLNKQFTRRALWKNPDGLPGGFEFIPRIYKTKGSEQYGTFPEGPAPDLDEIGKKYDWVVIEAVVNDFFRNIPGPPLGKWLLSKMPRMTSYVLVHPDYMCSFWDREPSAIAEFCFGYSFLPIAPSKTIFGYGPGTFTAAVKQFRWMLHENSDVEIQLIFLVSGRSEKILSLWHGFDPVYFTVNVINAITLNLLGFKQRAHDKLDAAQLSVHARIYQSLLEGMRSCWEEQNWAAAIRSTKAGGSGS
jgi:hypothetical protein